MAGPENGFGKRFGEKRDTRPKIGRERYMRGEAIKEKQATGNGELET
jgi:hypothetical protein